MKKNNDKIHNISHTHTLSSNGQAGRQVGRQSGWRERGKEGELQRDSSKFPSEAVKRLLPSTLVFLFGLQLVFTSRESQWLALKGWPEALPSQGCYTCQGLISHTQGEAASLCGEDSV